MCVPRQLVIRTGGKPSGGESEEAFDFAANDLTLVDVGHGIGATVALARAGVEVVDAALLLVIGLMGVAEEHQLGLGFPSGHGEVEHTELYVLLVTVDSKDPYTLQLCQDGIGSNRTEAVTVSADGIEGKLRELLCYSGSIGIVIAQMENSLGDLSVNDRGHVFQISVRI